MSDNKTPILYVLSPGADPRIDIISKKEELEINMFEESLGQGSEDKAEEAIRPANREGHLGILAELPSAQEVVAQTGPALGPGGNAQGAQGL